MKIFLACSCVLLLPVLSFAAFEDFGVGARAAGLANSFTAVSDDLSALAFNPAGLGNLGKTEISSQFARFFAAPGGRADVESIFFGFSQPLQLGERPGSLAFGFQRQMRRDFSKDTAFSFHYGTRGIYPLWGGRAGWGGSLKILKRDSLIASDSTSGLGLDAGAFYLYRQRYALGLSLLNFNQPDLSLNQTADRAPRILRLGLATKTRGLLLTTDLVHRASSRKQGGFSLAMASERWWSTRRHGSYALRSGLSLGNRSKLWTLGASLRLFGTRLDYALSTPLSGSIILGHTLSLTHRFGEPSPQEEYERLLQMEMESRKEIQKMLQRTEREEEKLRLEVFNLKLELETLRKKLAERGEKEEALRQKLESLEGRREKAEKELKKIQEKRREQKAVDKPSALQAFQKDWGEYLKLEKSGAPKSIRLQKLRTLLSTYRGKKIDLGPANRELLETMKE